MSFIEDLNGNTDVMTHNNSKIMTWVWSAAAREFRHLLQISEARCEFGGWRGIRRKEALMVISSARKLSWVEFKGFDDERYYSYHRDKEGVSEKVV